MDRVGAKEYLAEIAELIEDNIHEATIDNTDDGAVLLMTAASPFAEGEELAYSVSFEEFKADMYIFQIMIFTFTNIPEERFDEVRVIINALNSRISLGGFVLFEESKAVFFNHSFLLDETADAAVAARILLRSIGLMENAVVNAGQWILRLLGGERTVESVLETLGEEEQR
ncbi:MAG: hypothetical protein J6Y20_13630 [Lachnospiraceae bacterium]|nr:hypothetical protein [Lachnospiraceae bacterium]